MAVTAAGSFVAAALKHVAVRAHVDALTGEVRPQAWGVSDADLAALEWALRLGELWSTPVVAVTAGPGRAEEPLREAAAVGASRLVRVDVAAGMSSRTVAAALAPVLADASVVCCGDASVDRGSGAVPAFLAHELGAGQALGLTEIDPARPGVLLAVRRLDRGRRERLRVTAPAVVSVEAAGVRLRRASLPGVLAARDAAVEVVPAETGERQHRVRTVRRGPYRPRARVLPPPSGADARTRVLALTGVDTEHVQPRILTADPDAGAAEILAFLRETGYLR